MKKKVIKLIFDIMISLVGLVGAWSCMSQGFEYLFLAENPDMAAFKICSSIFISIATALLIFIFIPLDIDGIQKIRREKESKKTVAEELKELNDIIHGAKRSKKDEQEK